jgi:hypothetical protein
MSITVVFNDPAFVTIPEEQILVLHKLLWLHAREVISNVQKAPSTYSFYCLSKENIKMEDLDFLLNWKGSIAHMEYWHMKHYMPTKHTFQKFMTDLLL